jgi:tripartite-type tricarboxylate transporter receptor subunit TctC
MNIGRRNLGGALALLAMPSVARAQGSYPNKPVRIVIGFPPGGGVDIMARLIAPKLSDRLGQPVIVENRPGANGNIAMEAAAKSPADGYTLFYGNIGNLAVTNALYSHLSFDTARDFAPIAQSLEVALVVAIANDLPPKTLQEFVAYAKARPGELNGASAGAGGTSHLALALLNRLAGTDITHVPYRGSAPALQDLSTNRVQLMLDSYSVVRPMVDAGKVRLLASTGPAREALLPNLPTTAEARMPDFTVTSWHGLVAPSGTPAPVISKLEDAMRWALRDTDLPRSIEGQGAVPRFRGAADFAKVIADDRAQWSAVIRDAKITVE